MTRLLSGALLLAAVATVTFVDTAVARAQGFHCAMGTFYDRTSDQCVFRHHGRHGSHWTHHGTFDQGGYDQGGSGSSQSQSDHEVY